MKDVVRYFEEYADLYDVYFKGMGKLNLHKKPKDSFVYESVHNSVVSLSERNNTEVERTKAFVSYIDKILVPGLKTAIEIYS